ncbi:MAG: hypothetical protein PHC53_02295 [Patescibacteria group bacterium]|nr:hypothetical protein [Patescibacteria group bacterium]
MRPPEGRRYKKPHPPTCLSSTWFKKHGPLKARITKNNDLFLEHDYFRFMPDMVIGDLLERGIVVYFAGENRLGLEHKLHCLIGNDHVVKQLVASPGIKVPKKVTKLLIVMQFGKKEEDRDVLVDDEDDECTYQELLICEVSTILDSRAI